MFSRGSCELVLIGVRGSKSLETGRSLWKTFHAEKCFPCLAWGRRWASRFRAGLSRQWPRRRKPLRSFRTPLRPPPATAPLNPLGHLGRNDGRDDAAIAVSDATAAMRDGTHVAPVSLLRRRLQPLRRNSHPPLRTDKDEESLMLSSSYSEATSGRAKPMNFDAAPCPSARD